MKSRFTSFPAILPVCFIAIATTSSLPSGRVHDRIMEKAAGRSTFVLKGHIHHSHGGQPTFGKSAIRLSWTGQHVFKNRTARNKLG